jgi:hypothetical protein
VVRDLFKKANTRSAKEAGEKRKAKKLKIIARQLVRELKRKLSSASLAENQSRIELFEVLKQKNRIKTKFTLYTRPKPAALPTIPSPILSLA